MREWGISHLIFNRRINEYGCLQPLVWVISWFNPLYHLTVICFQVNDEAPHWTTIHVVPNWQTLWTLDFGAYKSSPVTMITTTGLHVRIPSMACGEININEIASASWSRTKLLIFKIMYIIEDRMLANLKPNRLVPLETCGTYLLKN